MKAIVAIGASSSGKSSWAANFLKQHCLSISPWIEINRDDIRRSLFNFGPWHEYRFTRAKEQQVTEEVDKLLKFAVDNKYSIIDSNTNLTAKYREPYIEKLKALGYEVELRVFDVLYTELVRRSAARQWAVEPSVLYKQWLQMQEYLGVEKHVFSTKKTDCVVSDLDGCLAHMDGKRGPFEWHNVGRDSCDEDVADLLFQQREHNNREIIILSGRDSCCREETEQWLKEHVISYTHLYMRTAGDQRPDYIVKKELYDLHLKDNYNIRLWVDDRPQIVRMVKSLGIKTLVCGDPYVEF